MKPEPVREQPEDLAVAARLAERRNRGLVERDVVVAPRPHDIEVLELRGGREDDVGVRRRVGHELLAHDGEEVVSTQAGEHLLLVGRDRGRVRVPDDEGRHRRVEIRVGQGLADARHVERARRALAQLRLGEPRLVEHAEHAGRDVGESRRRAAATSPRARECTRSCGTRSARPRAAARPRRGGSATAGPAPARARARADPRPGRRSAAPAARPAPPRAARRARRSRARAPGTTPRPRGRRPAARA